MKTLATFVLALMSLPAMAWTPTKPIEAVIGFAPGSGNELVFRTLAAEVETNTKANFQVVHRPGAGGVVGSEYFTRQPNDGHHVIMISLTGLLAMDKIAVPDATKGRSYTTDSFTYVMGAATTPFAIVTSTKDPVNTAEEFFQAIRNENVSVGSSGGSRMVYETLNVKIPGNKMVHVPYKGPSQQLTDVAVGDLRFGVVPATVAQTFLNDPEKPRIKVVAVTSARPIKQWPKVRTLSSVMPNLAIPADWGLMLPANTAPEVVEWYSREFRRALQTSKTQVAYEKNLLSVMDDALTPDAFRDYVKKTERFYQPVVEQILANQSKQ